MCRNTAHVPKLVPEQSFFVREALCSLREDAVTLCGKTWTLVSKLLPCGGVTSPWTAKCYISSFLIPVKFQRHWNAKQMANWEDCMWLSEQQGNLVQSQTHRSNDKMSHNHCLSGPNAFIECMCEIQQPWLINYEKFMPLLSSLLLTVLVWHAFSARMCILLL